MGSEEFTTPLRIEINDLEQKIIKLRTENKFLKKENKLLRELVKKDKE